MGCSGRNTRETSKMKMVEQAFNPGHVPTGHHWAVLIFAQSTIEREGCWTPPRIERWTETVTSTEYWYTEDKNELEQFLRGILLERPGRRDYIVLEVLG